MVNECGASFTEFTSPNCMHIHRAAAGGHVEILEFLLDHGVPIDSPDLQVKTAGYCATKEDQLEALKFLEKKGAEIFTLDIFMKAVETSEKITEYLLSKNIWEKIKIDYQNEIEKIKEQYAKNEIEVDVPEGEEAPSFEEILEKCESEFRETTSNFFKFHCANRNILKMLLNLEIIQINFEDLEQYVHLQEFEKWNVAFDNFVKKNGEDFLKKKIENYQKDKETLYIRNYVVIGGWASCTEKLLKFVDINAQTSSVGFTNYSALHFAEKSQILTLLKNGADVNACHPNTPFLAQCKRTFNDKDFIEIAEIFLSVGANILEYPLLSYCAQNKLFEGIKYLIKKGIPTFNPKTKCHFLFDAIKEWGFDNSKPLVTLIEMFDVDPNIRAIDDWTKKSCTLFEFCYFDARSTNTEVLKALKKKGMNVRDFSRGKTSLGYAFNNLTQGDEFMLELMTEFELDEPLTNKGENAITLMIYHSRLISLLKLVAQKYPPKGKFH